MRFFRRQPKRRLLVLGLDCAPPELVFETFHEDLPNLRQLVAGGTWGTLRSSVPCITVPAWASMTTSRDPGVLGVYGFRNRSGYDYDGYYVADGSVIRHPRVWDVFSEANRTSIVMNVPQTYPVRPINGHLVSGFLTPGTHSQFTYPAIFKGEVLKHFPTFGFDVKGFRTEDKLWLRGAISDMTEVQFGLLKHTLTTHPWDFAMFVNMGTDRIHHGFWRYHDPQHRLHEQGHTLQHTIRDYYQQVDTHIGEILSVIDDDTIVMVVSDHGVRRMDGAIAINEWLWREGWLSLKEPPPEGEITRFEDVQIDWAKTRAWSTGGYYGRIFLNVAGREPQGPILQADYEVVRDDLAVGLQAIPAPDGSPLNTTVFKPQDIYTEVNGIAPDLMVYFGDLHWRCVGSFGHGGIYTLSNDTGPDDANHDPDGMFLIYDPRQSGAGQIASHQLMDIAPTILNLLRVNIPQQMQGRVIR
jgi:predicted AlkP superfamily phosphohydrolase/phosphomutase